MANFTAALADPPESFLSKNPNANFILLYGLAGLNAYLIERRAVAALPLLLAVHRRLEMKHKARIAITSDVWKDAGDPSRTTRETMLAHLRRLPELVSIHEVRRVASRYRVEKGPAWRQIERAGREGVEQEDDD
jgi:hypothetical protein